MFIKALKKFFYIALIFVPHLAFAFHIDGNVFYFSDAFKITSTDASSFMAADASVNIALDSKKRWSIGWSYLTLTSQVKTAADNVQFSTSDMGPRVEWYISKDRAWGLGVVYNLISNATFKGASLSNVKWRGTSIKADFGYTAEFGETFHLGMRANYYSASWIEQLIGSTEYSKITYTRGWIYPSLFFRWDL